jgi:hypothetical protein
VKHVTSGRRAKPPRRPLARLLDRLTPSRMSIVYGPEKYAPEGSPYARVCNRCLHRDRRGAAKYFAYLADARASAKRHRRTRGHFGMRVVYTPEEP